MKFILTANTFWPLAAAIAARSEDAACLIIEARRCPIWAYHIQYAVRMSFIALRVEVFLLLLCCRAFRQSRNIGFQVIFFECTRIILLQFNAPSRSAPGSLRAYKYVQQIQIFLAHSCYNVNHQVNLSNFIPSSFIIQCGMQSKFSMQRI